MNALWRVAARELLDWRRSPAMIAAWIAVVGATLLVTTISSTRTSVIATAHRQANSDEHNRWIAMGDLPVHKAAHVALHAVRELPPLRRSIPASATTPAR